jgi:tryptophan halogenase
VQVEKGGDGIAALVTETGERITADLYVDASGFRSELLGRALGETFRDYQDALFCDRAVIGGWPRTNEPILPCTTAETMDAGWCWQIEHEHFINRGYVYSSAFISDEAAQAEFLRKNPKIATTPRTVRFRAGRYERCWVGNVVAVGNASGFVEPLEATALGVVCSDAAALAECLLDSLCEPTPSMTKVYNEFSAERWDDIRNFLALHYKFNVLADTTFWRACRADTPLHGAENVVDYYRENGPSVLGGPMLVHSASPFRMDGYLTILVGMNVAYDRPFTPPPAEQKYWQLYCLGLAADARKAMDVREALNAIRPPSAKWAS